MFYAYYCGEHSNCASEVTTLWRCTSMFIVVVIIIIMPQIAPSQVCTSLQTDNYVSIPPLSFYRLDAIPGAQATTSKHSRQIMAIYKYVYYYYYY